MNNISEAANETSSCNLGNMQLRAGKSCSETGVSPADPFRQRRKYTPQADKPWPGAAALCLVCTTHGLQMVFASSNVWGKNQTRNIFVLHENAMKCTSQRPWMLAEHSLAPCLLVFGTTRPSREEFQSPLSPKALDV